VAIKQSNRRTSAFYRIFINPQEKRLRAGWRILFMGLLTFFGFLLLAPLLLLAAANSSNPTNFLLINAIYSAVPLTISIFLSRRLVDRRTIQSMGLETGKRPYQQAWRDLLIGMGIAGVMFLLVFTLEWISGWIQVEGTILNATALENGEFPVKIFGSLLLVFITFLLVGWSEELLFRGYLMVNLRDGLNLFWAVVLTSITFALAHSLNPGVSWEAIAGLALSGLFFAYAALWSRGLWLPIGIHIGWNFVEGAIFGFPVSGMATTSLVQISQTGPQAITGGNFGPEAGLILIPALAAGYLLVYLIYFKRR
jgi:uncharacterized protein